MPQASVDYANLISEMAKEGCGRELKILRGTQICKYVS